MENRAVTCQGGTQHPILTLVSLKVSVSPVPLPPGITWNSPDCQRADVLPSPPLTLKYTASSSRRYNISNWNDSNRAPESESFLFFFFIFMLSVVPWRQNSLLPAANASAVHTIHVENIWKIKSHLGLFWTKWYECRTFFILNWHKSRMLMGSTIVIILTMATFR